MNNWKVGEYIVKENMKTNYPIVLKIEIEEVTEKTIKVKNLDKIGSINNRRYTKEEFDKAWVIFETL